MTNPSEHFISVGRSQLQYFKSGEGLEVMLAFHGFGQDRKAFDSIIPPLSGRYTWYTFNLFFHGKSKWAEGEKAMEPSFINKIISQFLVENNIDTFSLVGFSLGGKFAMIIAGMFPEKVNSLFLIAPDGIRTSFWYSLATYPLLFRRIFKSMIRHPGPLQNLIRLILFFRLSDKGLLRFAEHQMNTEEKRKRVYYSWVVFRHLRPALKDIAACINNHNIQLVMITGKHDRVIRTSKMKKLLKRVKKYDHLVLNCGHNELIKNSEEALRNRAFSFKKTGK